MTSRSSHRQEQLALADSLRAHGQPWHAIATTLRERYNLNARVAMRLAHGWGQADAAAEWNRHWPDDPKTFKNFSYWENWPSPTGHAPPLPVLDRLAQLYECDAADLVAGWSEHRTDDNATANDPQSDVLAWQLANLSLADMARTLRTWSTRLPANVRRVLLLKLSTSAALAATEPNRTVPGAAPDPAELTGTWDSTYTYFSSGRGSALSHTYRVELRGLDGRLVGQGSRDDLGILELELTVEGLLVTGSWVERTASNGYYRGAVYRGVLQLVLDPTGRSMTGRWLGPDKQFAINAGPWTLTRCGS